MQSNECSKQFLITRQKKILDAERRRKFYILEVLEAMGKGIGGKLLVMEFSWKEEKLLILDEGPYIQQLGMKIYSLINCGEFEQN